MPYADDAAVASESPEQFRKMMVVIVSLRAAFGLAVLEGTANTQRRVHLPDVHSCATDRVVFSCQ